MSADLVMPMLPSEQQHSRHFLPKRPHHSRSRSYQLPQGPQISPINTAGFNNGNNSGAVSTPPSPKTYNARHVRPLYMPAALRPNDEFPSIAFTKPKSGDTSSDSGSDSTLRRSNTGFMNLPAFSGIGQRLSRRSTGGSPNSGNSLNGDWNLELFPEVTEMPTRNHWKPDVESTICDDPTCKRTFSYFIRRHHCRKCGNIFCDWHSSFAIPLDQDANFNPRASPCRTCNHCFDQFKLWHGRRDNSQATSSASSSAAQTVPSTPIMAHGANAFGLPQGPEIPASVPRDWNWSTF